MNKKQREIVTVEGSDSKAFTDQVNQMLKSGYQILSSDCSSSRNEAFAEFGSTVTNSFTCVLIKYETEEDLKHFIVKKGGMYITKHGGATNQKCDAEIMNIEESNYFLELIQDSEVIDLNNIDKIEEKPVEVKPVISDESINVALQLLKNSQDAADKLTRIDLDEQSKHDLGLNIGLINKAISEITEYKSNH